MIALEHINFVVTDLKRATAFYGTIFPHWRVRSEGTGDWNGKPRRWLHFGDDRQYLAFSDHGEGDNRDLAAHQVGLAHFAFQVDDLDGLKARMKAAGHATSSDGADNRFRKNVYYIDPDGFEVEFVEYLSDIPSERNNDD